MLNAALPLNFGGRISTKFQHQFVVSFTMKSLGERICELMLSGDFTYYNGTLFNFIPNMMITDVYLFRFRWLSVDFNPPLFNGVRSVNPSSAI